MFAGDGWLDCCPVLPVIPCACAYSPVRKQARLGEHNGDVTKALRNVTPSAASRSTFGVIANGCPVQCNSSQRKSSINTTTMLGLELAACATASPAIPARNSRRLKSFSIYRFQPFRRLLRCKCTKVPSIDVRTVCKKNGILWPFSPYATLSGSGNTFGIRSQYA